MFEEPVNPIANLLYSVIDNMWEGFQIISGDWKYIYVNNTVALQGKRTKDQLLGKTMMECYPSIETTDLFRQMSRVKTEKISIQMENEFVYPNGTKGWFQLFIHPLDEGLLVLSTDITDRKEIAEKIKTRINNLQGILDSIDTEAPKFSQLRQEIIDLHDLIPECNSKTVIRE